MQIPEIEITVSANGPELLRKTLRPGDYVIGREPDCDVPLDVERVSPRHAELVVNFDHALIEDLGSGSGTFVNGQRVKMIMLKPGDSIAIGKHTVVVTDSAEVRARSLDYVEAKAAVPKITRQSTRKTCGSLLAALEVHPRVAMQILRHNKIAITMEIYTEVPSAATREALHKLGQWLEEAGT